MSLFYIFLLLIYGALVFLSVYFKSMIKMEKSYLLVILFSSIFIFESLTACSLTFGKPHIPKSISIFSLFVEYLLIYLIYFFNIVDSKQRILSGIGILIFIVGFSAILIFKLERSNLLLLGNFKVVILSLLFIYNSIYNYNGNPLLRNYLIWFSIGALLFYTIDICGTYTAMKVKILFGADEKIILTNIKYIKRSALIIAYFLYILGFVFSEKKRERFI